MKVEGPLADNKSIHVYGHKNGEEGVWLISQNEDVTLAPSDLLGGLGSGKWEANAKATEIKANPHSKFYEWIVQSPNEEVMMFSDDFPDMPKEVMSLDRFLKFLHRKGEVALGIAGHKIQRSESTFIINVDSVPLLYHIKSKDEGSAVTHANWASAFGSVQRAKESACLKLVMKTRYSKSQKVTSPSKLWLFAKHHLRLLKNKPVQIMEA